jgi:hypothetical protein
MVGQSVCVTTSGKTRTLAAICQFREVCGSVLGVIWSGSALISFFKKEVDYLDQEFLRC